MEQLEGFLVLKCPKMVLNPYIKDVLRDDVVQYSAPSKLPLIAKM